MAINYSPGASIDPIDIWRDVLPDEEEPKGWALDIFTREMLAVASQAVLMDTNDRPFSEGETPVAVAFNAGSTATHAWAAERVRMVEVKSA